jgi:hypothetical protein
VCVLCSIVVVVFFLDVQHWICIFQNILGWVYSRYLSLWLWHPFFEGHWVVWDLVAYVFSRIDSIAYAKLLLHVVLGAPIFLGIVLGIILCWWIWFLIHICQFSSLWMIQLLVYCRRVFGLFHFLIHSYLTWFHLIPMMLQMAVWWKASR